MMQKIKGLPFRVQIMSVALTLGLFTVVAPLAIAATQGVDTDTVILANGNILTMNSGQPTASAIAVKEGRIIAVGDLA